MSTPFGVLASNPVVGIGGVLFTDFTSLIVLQASWVTATGANSTARLPGGTSGYQVTAGKTLYIRAVGVDVVTTGEIGLVYSDNDVGTPAGTGFTNPVYWSGDSANQSFFFLQTPNSTQINSYYERALFFPVPATKYVGLTSVAGKGNVTFFGIEI